MTGYDIPLKTRLQLTLARQHLAAGATLSHAAQACDMERGELDLWLWRTCGTPTLGRHREDGDED